MVSSLRFLILIILLASANYASADVGYYINEGQPPSPANDEGEPDIRMAAEEVDIVLHPGGVDVVGVFEFVNDSDEPRDVGMFYPLNVGTLELTDEAREKQENDDFFGFELELEEKDVTARFDVEVNGDNIKYETANIYYDSDGSTEELTGNAIWTTSFTPREKKTVKVFYFCNYGTQGAPYGCREFYYVLYTGAPWKGPIGEGRITIKPGPDFDWAQPILPRTMDMPPLTVHDDRLEWTFKDFEPSAPDTEKGVKHGIWNGSAIEIVVPRRVTVSGDRKVTGVTGDATVLLIGGPRHPDYNTDPLITSAEIPANSEVTLLTRVGKWYSVYYEDAPNTLNGLYGWVRVHEYDEETKEERFNIVEMKVY